MKKILLITFIFIIVNAKAHAVFVNIFSFEFTDGLETSLGTGIMTFETETPTGTFAINALTNFEFDVTVTAEGFEESGLLNHFNDDGEEIILSGSIGTRSIAFNDPIGNFTRFGETDFYIAFRESIMTAHINNNGDRIEDANWNVTDMTAAVPEPSIFSLVAGLALTSLLLARRLKNRTM